MGVGEASARLAAVAVAIFVATPARGDVPSLFEKAATFEPVLHFGEAGSLGFEPLVQARWTLGERVGDPTVSTFSVPRARFGLTATLFDAVIFHLRVGARQDGTATFEQAYVRGKLGRFTLTAGQFFLLLVAPDEPFPQDLSTVDYCTYANTFSGGDTQGLQLTWDGPVHVDLTVGNGARSGFAEVLAPIVADIATTARVDVPIGARRVRGFDVQPSFRKGQSVTARLGGVVHWQTRRALEDHPAYDLVLGGGDVSVRGSGFSLLASTTYMRWAPEGGVAIEQLGGALFGSIFPARRTELFTQLDAVWPVGARAPLPSYFAEGQPGTTPFRTLTVGAAYYVLPDVNRLKIQIDLQTMFDAQSTSIAVPNASLGILPASGAQFAARVQITAAL